MSRPFWRVAVRSEFSACHALRNYMGKCENMHGHNFSVEACIEGETLTTDTELLLDFSVIKTVLKDILSALDHKDLNMIEPFTTINPSSENIARYIYKQLIPYVQEYGVRVYSVTVGEKDGQSATYFESE